MKIAMISCWAYHDAWRPFLALLRRFWPDHPPVTIISDHWESWLDIDCDDLFLGPRHRQWRWCELLAAYAWSVPKTDRVVLFQEDFFLSGAARPELIAHALDEMDRAKAGAVRLYPMPGAETDYGDAQVGAVGRAEEYRISCQAAIWRPDYLAEIAAVAGGTAYHFEMRGTKASKAMPDPVLAWKREAMPWPLEYLCSAITRGRWNPDAKRLCEAEGIDGVNWTMRGFVT